MATKQGRWTQRFLIATLLMNVVDATATILLLDLGVIHEANPILQWAYAVGGMVGLVTVKSVLVAGGSLILWTRREHPMALAGAYVCFVTYWTLLLWFWINITGEA